MDSLRDLLPDFVEGDSKEGCKTARCLRQNQRGGAGAAVAECKRRHKARRKLRAPQPVEQARQAIAVRDRSPF